MVLLAVGLAAAIVGVVQAQGPDAPAIDPAGGPPLTDSFTYQGRVSENGAPASGLYDFEITIWDDETAGTQISSTQLFPNQYVQDGIFTLHVMPGAAMSEVFDGGRRWIQVRVRPSGTTTYTALPRQPVTAVPYAWGLRAGAHVEDNMNDHILTLINNHASGSYGSALYARASSPSAPAVAGYHTGDGPGIYGDAQGGYPGVEGVHSSGGTAVGGYASGAGVGVYGSSSGSTELAGLGVVGVKEGYTLADLGSYYTPGGFFAGENGATGVTKENTGYGLFGWAQNSTGVSRAVYGRNDSEDGWAGYFWSSSGSGIFVSSHADSPGLTVAGGTKDAVVRTDDGSRLLYAEESSEVWFSDYGFGQLEDGVASIAIDPIFAQTVNLSEPYHVFVQVYGDAEVYVSERTPTGFEVHLRDGDASVAFSYRLVAKRLGFEDDRLGRAPWADDDPNLYPEKAQGASVQEQVGQRPGGLP
jgi:hypothetical protein